MPDISGNSTTWPEHDPDVKWLPNANRSWRWAREHTSVASRVLVVMLTVFFLKGIVIAHIHDPFTGHDEVAHYAYLRVVATEGRVPLIPDPAMWKAPDAIANPNAFDRIPSYFWKYCQFSTQDWSGCGDNQCPDSCYLHVDKTDGKIMPAGWIYTANHPPLYYLMMTSIYWLTDHLTPEEQLVWFRYAAIPFGMLTVLLAYHTVRVLFPNDPRQFLAITVPAVVAFQPQVSYEAAMLNNDILAIALTSVVIWLTAIGLRKRFPVWNCVLIGAFLGLALLAKTTSITVAALIAVAMVLGLGWRNWRAWVPRGMIAAGVAGLVAWPWFLYMYLTYGDFTALNRIHALQWWNYADIPAPTIWTQLTDREFVWRIWGQIWGGFGWHLISLSDDLLRILYYAVLFGAWGLAIYVARVSIPVLTKARRKGTQQTAPHSASTRALAMPFDRAQVIGLAMLGVMAVVSYAAILQFGTQFQGTQARYAFPSVNACAILLMVGVRSWFPKRWLPMVAIIVIVGLIWLNLEIYRTYVIPWNEAHRI